MKARVLFLSLAAAMVITAIASILPTTTANAASSWCPGPIKKVQEGGKTILFCTHVPKCEFSTRVVTGKWKPRRITACLDQKWETCVKDNVRIGFYREASEKYCTAKGLTRDSAAAAN